MRLPHKKSAILASLTSTATCYPSQVVLSQNREIYSNFIVKQRLACPASHAHGRAGFRPPACVPFLLRSAVLPSGASRHPFQKVHPHVFELVADHPEAQEEHPRVVLGACLVVRALVFRARRARGFGERRNPEAKGDVRLDLAGVRRAVEKAELHRAGAPHVVEVDRAVALMLS